MNSVQQFGFGVVDLGHGCHAALLFHTFKTQTRNINRQRRRGVEHGVVVGDIAPVERRWTQRMLTITDHHAQSRKVTPAQG